jgi:hypothetical protein
MRVSLSAAEARGLALRPQLFSRDARRGARPIDVLDRLGAIQTLSSGATTC